MLELGFTIWGGGGIPSSKIFWGGFWFKEGDPINWQHTKSTSSQHVLPIGARYFAHDFKLAGLLRKVRELHDPSASCEHW